MGTRGCVAVKQGKNSWKGIYNHFDSYPTNLGKEVFWTLRQYDNLDKFAEKLLKYKRWENFKEQSSGYNDVDYITNKNPDPLFMEWVYIVDTENRKIEVLTSEIVDSSMKERLDEPSADTPIPTAEGWDYGHCIAKHEKVEEIDLDSEEPNWDNLWKRVNAEI